ncbi:MAG: hypothetical protein KJ875_03310 [Alphaproteobacteria bacterium]|jgi:hypothetical protein|nr:hypothetical protein [Alphaproteobacteria bacterium]MBU2079031.1 hypothetical protein [Alphaproteobacteria bacterium]MBU2159924.1 hypothetical protein [Alphaproteobacteria bacterium]MBU2242809.1 hypothetical protein [Alphaproteobacteria bacterium]
MSETPNTPDTDPHVLSYHRVRQALGAVALLLPLSLIVGGLGVEGGLRDSLSNYFFSPLREVFVGALWAIGVFLMSYKGYARRSDERFSDQVLARISGLSALMVSVFPSLEDCPVKTEICVLPERTVTQIWVHTGPSAWVHNMSAVVFFLCLVVFCLVQFPKTTDLARRRIYRACGYGILATLVLITSAFLAARLGGDAAADFVSRHNLIFWGEALGVWIFALAWLTKGKADQSAIRLMRTIVPGA